MLKRTNSPPPWLQSRPLGKSLEVLVSVFLSFRHVENSDDACRHSIVVNVLGQVVWCRGVNHRRHGGSSGLVAASETVVPLIVRPSAPLLGRCNRPRALRHAARRVGTSKSSVTQIEEQMTEVL